MLKARYILKFKDKQGRIIGYRLEDENGLIKERSIAERNELLESTTNEIKIVGIVKPSESSQSAMSVGSVLYKKDLMVGYIDEVNNSDVVKLQVANETTNLMWNRDFNNPYTEADYVGLQGSATDGGLDGKFDTLNILFVLIALCFLVDWGVYCYDKYQLR